MQQILTVGGAMMTEPMKFEIFTDYV